MKKSSTPKGYVLLITLALIALVSATGAAVYQRSESQRIYITSMRGQAIAGSNAKTGAQQAFAMIESDPVLFSRLMMLQASASLETAQAANQTMLIDEEVLSDPASPNRRLIRRFVQLGATRDDTFVEPKIIESCKPNDTSAERCKAADEGGGRHFRAEIFRRLLDVQNQSVYVMTVTGYFGGFGGQRTPLQSKVELEFDASGLGSAGVTGAPAPSF